AACALVTLSHIFLFIDPATAGIYTLSLHDALPIFCSGTDDQFTLEDATVAGLFVEGITALGGPWDMPESSDSAIACRRLWQSERSEERRVGKECRSRWSP